MEVIRNIASSVLSSVVRPVVVQKGALLNYMQAIARDVNGDVIIPNEVEVDGIAYNEVSFLDSGTFEVIKSGGIDLLVVAGGGGGGFQHAGGGGAGGVTFLSDYNLPPSTFNVNIGSGGAGATVITENGENGEDSSFGGILANGGGGGGSGASDGNAGGSGGGAGGSGSSLSNEGIGIAEQGHNGGKNKPATNRPAGGGGGGESIGATPTLASIAGDGGGGVTVWESEYAGGGGGSVYLDGTAGSATHGGGAGGAGSSSIIYDGEDATINTGGGGGGGNRPSSSGGSGGLGGSGIVVLRYKKKVMPINIFLVAGQSNTDGRVDVTDANAPSYLSDNVVDGVKVWNGSAVVEYDLTDTGQSGNGSSWILSQTSGKFSFAHVALKKIAEKLENIVVCQVTSGGTPLAAVSNTRGSWNADYDIIPDGTPALTEALETRFSDLISYFTANNISYNINGLIFHQGETDDDSWLDEEAAYSDNFTALMSKIRQFTNKPLLPIWYGTVPSSSQANSTVIKNVHLDYAVNDNNAYCRDNDDLTLFDSFHFDAISCIEFGEWVSGKVT